LIKILIFLILFYKTNNKRGPMKVLPENFSPLHGLLGVVHGWNKSTSFFTKHIVTRVTCAVALPFAALATLAYHVVAQSKWVGYSIGKINWKGKPLSERLPEGFDEPAIKSHGYQILTALRALVFYMKAVANPVGFTKDAYEMKLWVKKRISAVRQANAVTYAIKKDPLSPTKRRSTEIPVVEVDEDITSGTSQGVVLGDKANKRLSQRVSRALASTEPSVQFDKPDQPIPETTRGRKPPADVRSIFPQSATLEDNKFTQAEDAKKRQANDQWIAIPPPPPLPPSRAPAKAQPQPPKPSNPPPRPVVKKGDPKARPLPQPTGAPSAPGPKKAPPPKGLLNNPRRRSQTIEENTLPKAEGSFTAAIAAGVPLQDARKRKLAEKKIGEGTRTIMLKSPAFRLRQQALNGQSDGEDSDSSEDSSDGSFGK
jgi:hypothetical protein